MTLFLLIALLLLICAAAPADPARTIVAFGDSTTATRGDLVVYAHLLQEHFPRVHVINAGVGGNSTVMARARFEQDVLAHDPAMVIIQFGINDSAIDVWQGDTEPRVPIAEYAANLRGFVQTLKQRGSAPILMTPNPMCWTDELRGMYGKPPYDVADPDGFNLHLKQYAQQMRVIAAEADVPLVDSYAVYQAYAGEEGHALSDLLLDGMHPNARGQALEAELLLPHVRRILEGE
jgi:lysophospholipase L1-like esterase